MRYPDLATLQRELLPLTNYCWITGSDPSVPAHFLQPPPPHNNFDLSVISSLRFFSFFLSHADAKKTVWWLDCENILTCETLKVSLHLIWTFFRPLLSRRPLSFLLSVLSRKPEFTVFQQLTVSFLAMLAVTVTEGAAVIDLLCIRSSFTCQLVHHLLKNDPRKGWKKGDHSSQVTLEVVWPKRHL